MIKTADNAVAYLLMAPWLLGFIGMWLIPAIISIYYSFTDFNLLNTPRIIGFANYVRAFTQDETFVQALKVTFLYVLVLVPLRLAFALFVAMLLNKKHKGLGLYRTLYYVPSIIGGSIAVSVVWKQIFGNKGVVMTLLSVFGMEQAGQPQHSFKRHHPHGRMAVWFLHVNLFIRLKADSLYPV